MSGTTIALSSVRLECHLAGSSKFWCAEIRRAEPVSAYAVNVRWGRIGTLGQGQARSFSTQGQADEFVRDKVREKLRKGYERVGTTTREEPKVSSRHEHVWSWKSADRLTEACRLCGASRRVNEREEASRPIECAHSWIDVTTLSDARVVLLCTRCNVRQRGDFADASRRRIESPPSIILRKMASTVPPPQQDDIVFPAERIIRLTED
jgi:predicted DNA-binding WGR domain protein